MEKHGKDKTEDAGKKQNVIQKLKSKPWFVPGSLFLLIVLIAGGIIYWQYLNSRVYVEKAELRAPLISLSSKVPGILDKIYVQEGDLVGKGRVVAKVGNEEVKTMTGGYIASVTDTPGQYVTPQNSLVEMYNPKELVLVGRVEEDKGLQYVSPGQDVVFTVDAYGSKAYHGFIHRIVPSSRQSDIVFSISDKREEREFEVLAKFDVGNYPELRNGMSAKMWIYK
jgi:multidrug resistance efflux pump